MIKLLFWSFKLAFHQQNFSTNPFKTLFSLVALRLCAFCFALSHWLSVWSLPSHLALSCWSFALFCYYSSAHTHSHPFSFGYFASVGRFFFGFRPIFHMYKHFKFMVSCKKKEKKRKKCEYESRAKSCTYLYI